MICLISDVKFDGLFSLVGNGIVVLIEFWIFCGMFSIIGVVNILGVIVIMWMFDWVSLCVVGRVMVVIVFLDVV